MAGLVMAIHVFLLWLHSKTWMRVKPAHDTSFVAPTADCLAYCSTTTFAALITSCHFAASALMKAANSSGEVTIGS
jgi:hypothetical protein